MVQVVVVVIMEVVVVVVVSVAVAVGLAVASYYRPHPCTHILTRQTAFCVFFSCLAHV
jgi:hypothetical protein